MAQQQLELQLLGSPLILLDGKPLEGLPSRAAEALFYYLACHDRPVSREKLAELLWSERTQEQGLANLRSILSSLRGKVGDYLAVTRQTISFNHALEYRLDTAIFENELSALEKQLDNLVPLTSEQAAHLRGTLELFRGDFLEGLYLREGREFEEWALITRERLCRLAISGLRRLVRYLLEDGRYAEGILYAEKLSLLDPYDEDPCRMLMELHLRNGQLASALQQYERLKRLLQTELNVEPAPATRALYERARGLTFPPPSNLPPDPTPFIGRDMEIEKIGEQLSSSQHRLLTIFGSGGIGKTRLAIEVVRRFVQHRRGQFLDGVFFVPLATVQSAMSLPSSLANEIGFNFQGTEAPQAQLVEHLRPKEMLLILDNFEQFVGEGAAGTVLLVEILRKAPRVKLVVTSRERINLYEEVVFDLPGLAVPQSEHENPEAFSAVVLFVQTARRLQAVYSPTLEDMNAIVQTCRLVDGAPLAIELAASWVRQYSVLQIIQRLEKSLDFLRTSYRNIPARHRSLRAVFEHSWELLSSPEQAVFCQLSIFEGGFTPEAAESVISFQSSVFSELDAQYEIRHIEHWLTSLADKSLLQTQSDGQFVFHPLLRQYAAEKQAEFTGVQDITPQRHASYYLDFVIRQGSGEEPEHRAALRTELANIRTAWQWAAQHVEVQKQNFSALEQAIPVLHNFYSIQSWFQEGVETFEFAANHLIAYANSPEQTTVLCDLLGRKARMHIHIGQLDLAQQTLEVTQTYLQKIGSPDLRSKILDTLAITYFYAGEYSRAEAVAEEILHYSERSGSQEGIAFAVNFWGSCAKAIGDYARAAVLFERAVDVYRTLDDNLGAAMVLNNLGNLETARRNFSVARRYYRESSHLFKEVDHIHGTATNLANEGKLALREGDYEEARRLLTESLELKRKMNDQRGMAIALTGLGDISAETGGIADARGQLAQALSLAHNSGDVRLVLEILVAVASLWVKAVDKEEAGRLLAFTLQHPALTQEARERIEGLTGPVQDTAVKETRLENVIEGVLKQLEAD